MMIRLAMVLSILCLVGSSLLGRVETNTSIFDVYAKGSDQVTGAITFVVDADDFSLAGGQPVSPENPLYLRIAMDRNAVLSRTIVDPTGTFTVAQHGALSNVPIDLHLRAYSRNNQIAADLPESAVQIIRAIQGESHIWLRISSPSNRWLDTNNDGIGDSSPSIENEVWFEIAEDKGLTLNKLSESGVDFDNLAAVDNYANFGEDTPAADTRFFVDYDPLGCGVDAFPNLAGVVYSVWHTGILPGSPGSPEQGTPTSVDSLNCISPGIPTNTYDSVPIVFVGDGLIARLNDESVLSSTLIAPQSVQVGEEFEVINQLIGDTLSLRLVWDLGGDKKTTTVNRVTWAFDREGEFVITSTATNGNGVVVDASTTITVVEATVPDEITNLSAHALSSQEIMLSWNAGFSNRSHLKSFEVYSRASVSDSREWKKIATTAQTWISIAKLESGERYEFRIDPIYAGGSSGKAAYISELTDSQDIWQYRTVFPHVPADKIWWTGIVLLNPSDSLSEFELLGWVPNSAPIKAPMTQLKPGQKITGLLGDFFTAQQLESIEWLELRSNNKLVGFELFGQSQNNMTGISVNHHGHRTGGIPISRVNANDFNGLVFLNRSQLPAQLKINAMDSDGVLITSHELDFSGFQKQSLTARSIFGDKTEQIAHLTWQSSAPMVSFSLWGDLNSWNTLSGQRSFGSGRLDAVITRVEPESILNIINKAKTTNRISIKAFLPNGDTATSFYLDLKPGVKSKLRVTDIIGPDFSGSLSINATHPFDASSQLNRRITSGLLSEAIPASSQFGDEFIFPHIAKSQHWTTELLVANPGDTQTNLRFTAFNAEGHLLSQEDFILAGNGNALINAHQLFSKAAEMAYIRVHSQESPIAAHMIYYTKPIFGHLMGGLTLSPQ